MNKEGLSERDISSKFITPTIHTAGWELYQYREEVQLTKGRVLVRGANCSVLEFVPQGFPA